MVLTAVAFVVLPTNWGVVAVVALADIGLAAGWATLTRSAVSPVDSVVVGLAGVAASVVVGATGEMSWAQSLVGVAVVALVTVEVFTAPTPRDHSRPDGTAPTAPPPSWLRTGTFPTMAVAVTAVPVVVGGSAWAALAWNRDWSVTTLLACGVTVLVVVGNQIGRTFRAQALWALVAGVLSGVLVSAGVAWAGTSGRLVPTVLPALATLIGERAAMVVHGAFTGVAVALAVIVVDALLGEHRRPSSRLGAVARGCTKYLVAAIPVYMMMRIGGA